MRAYFAGLNLAALIVVLCGCLEVTDSPDASVSANLAGHLDARARAECEWRKRCGELASQFDCSRAPRPESYESLLPLFSAQRMFVHVPSATACLEAIAQQPCQFGLLPPAECNQVFSGTGQLGEPCGTCARGLGCFRRGDVCGRCEPVEFPSQDTRPGLRESCISPLVDGRGCAADLICTNRDGGWGCEPVPGLGAECGGLCGSGLVCDDPDAGPRTCKPNPDLGEPCVAGRCKLMLRCDNGTCAALLAVGESCSEHSDCESTVCTGGVCVPRYASLNQSCVSRPCEPGLRCNTARLCVVAVGLGAGCSEEVCEAGSTCTEGVCRNPSLECRVGAP